MGVCFRACAIIEHVPDPTDDDFDNDVRELGTPSGLEHGLEGLPEGPGYYRMGPDLAHVDRSYGGYNRFRERLSKTVLGVSPKKVWRSPEKYRQAPFFDLIHFSDAEGVLGPASCRRIDLAFTDWSEHIAAAQVTDEDLFDPFAEQASRMAAVFRAAAGTPNGVVLLG